MADRVSPFLTMYYSTFVFDVNGLMADISLKGAKLTKVQKK
jgi:hypothetical protein